MQCSKATRNEMKKGLKKIDVPERGFEPQIFSNLNFHGK
jgi:hypothetical protein